jgi:hypothetical protein
MPCQRPWGNSVHNQLPSAICALPTARLRPTASPLPLTNTFGRWCLPTAAGATELVGAIGVAASTLRPAHCWRKAQGSSRYGLFEIFKKYIFGNRVAKLKQIPSAQC